MKQLPTQFTKGGFNHLQVWRDETHAIYQRWKPESESVHFECIRIKISPAHEMFGKQYPESETYPSSNEWGGVTAKTVATMAQAKVSILRMKEAMTKKEAAAS